TPRETRLISAVTDLTAAALERFRLRDQTERARQRAEILAHLNSAISRAKNENEIIDVIARYVQGLGAYFAGLNYATNEEWDTHLQSDVVVTWRDGVITNYRELGYQPERLFKYGVADLWLPHPYSVLYIENVETEPRLSQSQREGIMAAFKTRALVILPLFTGGVFQGLMNIAWAQPRVFDEQERYIFERLLQTVPAVVATRRALLAEQSIREE